MKKKPTELKKLFENFNGVKVVKHDTQMLDGGKKADIVQFEIVPRLKGIRGLKTRYRKRFIFAFRVLTTERIKHTLQILI